MLLKEGNYPSLPLSPIFFSPLYKTFIRPLLEYSIQATHPILRRNAEALEKVQKPALKIVKGLRHVPYEAALKQLRLFSLAHRRIRGDLIAMFKITYGLLEFPMASTFAHSTCKGLRGHAYKFQQRPQTLEHWLQRCPNLDVLRQYTFGSPSSPLGVFTTDPEKVLALARATF